MPYITSGKYKNRKLLFSKSIITKDKTRPTANYTKQLIMNIIKNGKVIPSLLSLENAVVADVCAGIGAIGFELLSNGAKNCYFIDINSFALDGIRKTAENIGIANQITTMTNMTNLRKVDQKIDFVFIDPPYQDQEKILANFLNIANKSDCITKDTIIMCETYKDLSENFSNTRIEILDSREAISKTFITTIRILDEKIISI